MSHTESEHSPDDSDDQEYEGLEDVLVYAKEPECTEAELEARSRRFEVNEDEAAAAAALDDVLVRPPVSRVGNMDWCQCSECASRTQREDSICCQEIQTQLAAPQPQEEAFSHCHFRKFTVNFQNFQNPHNKHKNACAELKLA